MTEPTRFIVHVDGDAFFASCEISRRPDLKGKPVVVGEDRGIASALTYEAKALGITRGMPIFQLRKQYPKVTVLSSHFELYESFRKKLVRLLKKYTDEVEVYSIDECFASICVEPPEAKAKLEEMKATIQAALGITLSFGLSTTKVLAKVASKLQKPDGCVILLDAKEVEIALAGTQIGSVWGIGRETTRELIAHNILTAKDFKDKPLSWIEEHFSKPVIQIWQELNGTPVMELETEREDQKSIQSTRSLSKRTSNRELLFSELSRNIELAASHAEAAGLYTNRVYVFYRTISEYSRYRKSVAIQLPEFTQDPSYILQHVKAHEAELYDKRLQYKSTGITLSNLQRCEFVPQDLFSGQTRRSEAEHQYLKAIADLRHKFGSWIILRASSLESVGVRNKESVARDKKDTYEYGLPLTYMGEVF